MFLQNLWQFSETPVWIKMTIKQVLVVLLPLVALARAENRCSAEISSMCPAVDPATPVYYPDPYDCSSYCECSDGIAWKFTCAPPTLFDDKLNICNWEHLVDCGDRGPTAPPKTTVPTTVPPTSTIPPMTTTDDD